MIRIVVALSAEARPLVERFRMEPLEGSFRLFRSEKAALVVSGIGRRACAAATAYLHAKTGEEPLQVWLNVGIAGHRSRAAGALVLAHTVRDAATGERWYPTRLGGPELDAAEIVTVDRPETEFSADALYDMESSGFYPTALGFSTAELVQCLKIVSDNRETSTRDLTPARVLELVESRTGGIVQLVEHLGELATDLEPLRREPEHFEELRSRWHLTASETRRLRSLLTRLQVLDSTPARRLQELRRVSSGRAAIERLGEMIDSLSSESE